MISYSSNRTRAVERAQPWLGTLVSIRVGGLAPCDTHRAIDAAFQEVATVHRLMSFHDPGSDLSRLNRAGAGKPVEVHPYTWEVLRQAIVFSASTEGCFDVTVGAELVEWKLLPRSADAGDAACGSWRDIELLHGNRVVFHRPLCVDLGGIAKGFAVDRATDCLRARGALQTVVNAGGDIRVQGKDAEPIRLSAESSMDAMPVLELTDGSVASSSGHLQRRWQDGRLCGPHVDGVHRSPAPTDRFVCVVAERCVIADALTKVVMAQGMASAAVLGTC
jgi:thiamine biosynthesis lipoprotein